MLPRGKQDTEGKKPRNHQEAVRKRASEVGGGAWTAGGIYINTKQMQNTEGVCANMKQACVFTARGADRPDDGAGGPCGGMLHLSSLRGTSFSSRAGGRAVWGGWRRRAGLMVEESRSGSAGGGATQNPEVPKSRGASKELLDAS